MDLAATQPALFQRMLSRYQQYQEENGVAAASGWLHTDEAVVPQHASQKVGGANPYLPTDPAVVAALLCGVSNEKGRCEMTELHRLYALSHSPLFRSGSRLSH